MSILAERVCAVVAVDTHTATHSAALLSPVGALLGQVTVGSGPAGLDELIRWVQQHCPPGPRAWVIDGTRSHGVGLVRYLREHRPHDEVIEAERDGNKARRRRNGKSDALDAVEIGRSALIAPKLSHPRADGPRETMRLLLATRRHYTDVRTATVNLFHALVLTAETPLREQLRPHTTYMRIRTVHRQLIDTSGLDHHARTRLHLLQTLAADITGYDTWLATNKTEIRDLVATWCTQLLDVRGVGPITAAQLLTAWSHKGRIRNDAAFAKLAGVSPLEASSGAHTRHRVNRGGDRNLNAALHTAALNRRRWDDQTRHYVNRRTAQGRNISEINRAIKRYLARKLFRIMEAHATTP